MIRILKSGEVKNEEIFARTLPTDTVADAVRMIISKVRQEGDTALFEYTKQFDHAALSELKVSDKEIKEALSSVEPKFLEVLQKATGNIRKFHEKQKRNSFLTDSS